jgi:hypothetical protein
MESSHTCMQVKLKGLIQFLEFQTTGHQLKSFIQYLNAYTLVKVILIIETGSVQNMFRLDGRCISFW